VSKVHEERAKGAIVLEAARGKPTPVDDAVARTRYFSPRFRRTSRGGFFSEFTRSRLQLTLKVQSVRPDNKREESKLSKIMVLSPFNPFAFPSFVRCNCRRDDYWEKPEATSIPAVSAST